MATGVSKFFRIKKEAVSTRNWLSKTFKPIKYKVHKTKKGYAVYRGGKSMKTTFPKG